MSELDALLAPDAPLHIRGTGLAGASVVVAGVAATTEVQSDTLLVARVPASVFAPCTEGGEVLDVTVRRGTTVVSRAATAVARPFELTLAPGGHALVNAAMSAGCPIRLSHQGEYLVMPYRTETEHDVRYGYGEDSSTTLFELDFGPAAVAAAALPLGARLIAHGPPAAAQRFEPPLLEAAPPPSPPRAGARSASGVSQCSLARAVGDSTAFTLPRDSSGAVSFGSNVPWRTEYWWLAVESGRLAVFHDRFTRDWFAASPALGERLRAVIARYDEIAEKVFERYLLPMPDTDENDRLIVYMSGVPGTAGGWAAVRTGHQPGCEDRGESVLVALPAMTAGSALTTDRELSVLVHEAAHVLHVSPARMPPDRRYPKWFSEGFANAMQLLAERRDDPAPLTANRAERSTHWSARCFVTVRWERPHLSPYETGCFRIVYALEQAMREEGLDLRVALQRFQGIHRVTAFGDLRNALSGTSRSASELTAEWFLARYADDRVAGVAPELRIGTWNSPIIKRSYNYVGGTAWDYPDHVLTSGSSYAVSLHRAEAHYVTFTVADPESERLVVRSASEEWPAAGVALLRVR